MTKRSRTVALAPYSTYSEMVYGRIVAALRSPLYACLNKENVKVGKKYGASGKTPKD